MWRKSKLEPVKKQEATGFGEAGLGDECAAFLAGGYRHYLDTRGQPIPAWAWINCLAHGDRSDIECAATLQTNEVDPDTLIAAIAMAALAHLTVGATLEALQRNTLVPLELALAAQAGTVPTNSLELGRALASALPKRLPPPMAPRCPDQ